MRTLVLQNIEINEIEMRMMHKAKCERINSENELNATRSYFKCS